MEKDYLILKRASASRPAGEWDDNDFDVLANGVVGLRPKPPEKAVPLMEVFVQRMQEIAGNSGFMLYFEMDHGAWLRTFGIRRKVVGWIFGNPASEPMMLAVNSSQPMVMSPVVA
jgi:hypothetical protein